MRKFSMPNRLDNQGINSALKADVDFLRKGQGPTLHRNDRNQLSIQLKEGPARQPYKSKQGLPESLFAPLESPTLIFHDSAKFSYQATSGLANAVRAIKSFRYSRDVALLSPGIKRAIDESRRILELEDNWDDEGSPRYEESTLIRATTFLVRTAQEYYKLYNIWIDAPRILHGPEGSIDLHWKTPSHELLINIPANSESPVEFYGDSGNSKSIKGQLDFSSNNVWILMWLKS